MSVRKGDRGEGKLQALNKARELKKYTLGLIKSEKHFPKSTRWIYASPIVNEIREACVCIRHANSVFVTNDEEYTYRRMEQVKAHESLVSWLANAARGDTYHERLKMINYFKNMEATYNAREYL